MSACGKRRLSRVLLLLLATACFEVCAAAGSEATNATGAPPPPPRKKRWRGARPRRPCAEDDAKCIALRDHECDPYFTNVTDKCTFVQYNRHCADDVHHINYLKLFYCRPPGDPRVLVALGFLLFMAMLFWTMSKVAEDFLVPALEFLAHWMRLAPDVAGVTLFAFASGAPDLFTQIAAVAVGGTVDQELAIGATLGAGLFIVAVILSIVMLCARPATAAAADGGSEPAGGASGSEPAGGASGSSGECCSGGSGIEEITDRRAFVRDAVAYLLSTLALLALMLRGTFTAWEAGLLLLGYGAYLAVCLWTSRGGGSGARPGPHHRGYMPVSPSQAGVQGQAPGAALQLAEQQANGLQRGGSSAAQLDGVVIASAVAGGGQVALPIATPRAQVELVSRAGAAQPQRKLSRTASPQANGAPGSLPVRGRALDADAAGQQQEQWQQWQQLEGGAVQENELAALVSSTQLSDALAPAAAAGAAGSPGISPRATPSRSKLRRVGGGLLHSASLGLDELLHTRGKSGPRLWLSVAMAPLTLLLHATMPALHAGTYTPWYALILALCGPLFTLLSTELYPHHLGITEFLLAWLLSALALYALLLAVPPAAGSAGAALPGLEASGAAALGAGASPVTVAAPGGPFGSSARLSRLSPGPASSGGSGATGGGLWPRVRQACSWQIRRPRRNALLAVLASLQCMLWMSLAADELVALFQAIGRIVDVSQDMLGATVLAWGEAVPELVATLSLARSGQATMAIAAVFGGPIFNVLIAWAGPTLYASLRRHEALPYRLSAGVGILVASTVAVLLFLLAAMPLAFRWRLSRAAAVALLSIYAVSQLLFLLAEGL